MQALWDRLEEIAQSLAPLVAGDGRIEVDPFEEAGRLRPETQFAPEVMLQARLFHSSDYFAPASAGRPRAAAPDRAAAGRARPPREDLVAVRRDAAGLP